MTMHLWKTIGLIILLIGQFSLVWFGTKRTGNFREAALPNILIAGATLIILVRELFGDLPPWIDVSMLIVCPLIVLIGLGLSLIRLKRYLKEAWAGGPKG